MAIATARGRAHGNEYGICAGNSLRKIHGEGEAFLAHIGCDKIVKAGLENRNLAAQKHGNAPGILIDANDIVTEIGKAGA
jgi:hypothetical protein